MASGGAGARPTFAELNPASVRAPVRSGGKYKYHWNACALSEAWKGEGCGRACKNSGFLSRPRARTTLELFAGHAGANFSG